MTINTITKENFEQEVLSGSAVLVDFWAPWCGYCRRIAPVVDQIAEVYKEKLKVGKINTDEQPELAEKFEINTIPTLILFQKGTASEPLIAPQSKAQIDALLKQHHVIE